MEVAVAVHFPALLIIIEIGGHDLVEDLAVHRRVFDRYECLDPALQIALHPVR